MTIYRKKPIEVEAIQFTGDNVAEIWDKFGADGIYGPTEKNPDYLILTTTHGDPAPARAGDWVVPDSKPGTFYPIKPDVFEATYEPASAATVDADRLPSGDYMATFDEFWRELVADGAGQLDLDKVARELHDYHQMMTEVGKVYDEVTGGRISKPNTAAHHVVTEANDVAARNYAWELCDRADTLDWDANVSLALREVAEEWHEGAWREYQEAKAQRQRIAAASQATGEPR